MATYYKLDYSPKSPKYRFSGTPQQLIKHLRKTHAVKVHDNEDGTWELATLPVRKIIEIVNEEAVREVCPDKYLRKKGIHKITLKDCYNLVSQLNDGEVKFSEL